MILVLFATAIFWDDNEIFDLNLKKLTGEKFSLYLKPWQIHNDRVVLF